MFDYINPYWWDKANVGGGGGGDSGSVGVDDADYEYVL